MGRLDSAASLPCKTPWLRFSLRTLLLIVLLSAIPCSWTATKIKQAKDQRAAVRAIRDLGGAIRYDYEFEQSGHVRRVGNFTYYDDDFTEEELDRAGNVRNANPTGPAWARNLWGDDLFANVVSVSFVSPVADSDLVHVKKFPYLQCLDLSNTQITDAGLDVLKGLKHLHELRIGNTKITDVGIRHLKGLIQLESLDLGGTAIGDAGLENLENLSQLRLLCVGYTRISDNGLVHLSRLSRLHTLAIGDTSITDAGLAQLEDLRDLKCVLVDGTKVTDRGVRDFHKKRPNCNIIR